MPLFSARTIAEDPCIAPTASTVSEARFVGVGYGNFIGGNAADIASYPMATEFGYNTNLGNRVGGNAADFGQSRVAGSGANHASDESGDDIVFGKKVEFLCSLSAGFQSFSKPNTV
ncbi:hypothetical protein CJ030_MR0G027756 [Morella rubra]|uniref:Uncharacterized protein n=1 Tax=Morella rubra TaxID=262757 RepID=A0A6A1UIW1_9ROSI|nr:hypothetical protein CJ030_MR0G027774 [Morella rubra]KAB1199080.1 hypothetical protein CJ030_MR0G027756 [Morella rubra]